MSDRDSWVSTTHDWSAAEVDVAHLGAIRRDAADGPEAGGLLLLVLGVLAYAAEEAEDRGQRGSCSVTIHADGSISVADDGRGTDTRRDQHGAVIKKPVIASDGSALFV